MKNQFAEQTEHRTDRAIGCVTFLHFLCLLSFFYKEKELFDDTI